MKRTWRKFEVIASFIGKENSNRAAFHIDDIKKLRLVSGDNVTIVSSNRKIMVPYAVHESGTVLGQVALDTSLRNRLDVKIGDKVKVSETIFKERLRHDRKYLEGFLAIIGAVVSGSVLFTIALMRTTFDSPATSDLYLIIAAVIIIILSSIRLILKIG